MMTLLSGYDQTTQDLIFRVYAAVIPDTDRLSRNRASHFCAYDLLGAALAEDFDIYHAKIKREGLGKPMLIHDTLQMNLSHCKGLAVAAVGRVPLGVDAEPPREITDKLIRTVCTSQETAWISGHADESKLFAFSREWTLKEAYTKYTGEGLRRPFSSLEFLLADGLEFRHPAAHKVQLYQLLHGEKYVVSLCVPSGAYDTKAADGWELTESGLLF